MIRLLLVRNGNERQTLGRMFVFSAITQETLFECASLELPWKDNRRNVSCIPEGVYPCKKIVSGTFGNIIAVNDVPGRDLIRIHAGNFLSDIRGCILPGRKHDFLDKDDLYDVLYSKATLFKLMLHLPSEFEMKVISL